MAIKSLVFIRWVKKWVTVCLCISQVQPLWLQIPLSTDPVRLLTEYQIFLLTQMFPNNATLMKNVQKHWALPTIFKCHTTWVKGAWSFLLYVAHCEVYTMSGLQDFPQWWAVWGLLLLAFGDRVVGSDCFRQGWRSWRSNVPVVFSVLLVVNMNKITSQTFIFFSLTPFGELTQQQKRHWGVICVFQCL